MGSARGRQRARNQHTGSPERYTPAWLMARVSGFLGGEFFDPCPASMGHPSANGLAMQWRGRVYINPPYGRTIREWIAKAMCEPADETILLLPAYTDALWYQSLAGCAMCFIKRRVYFDTPDGRTVRAPHPSVLVYKGSRTDQFYASFHDLGFIARTG